MSNPIATALRLSRLGAFIVGLFMMSVQAQAGTGQITLYVGQAGFIIGVSGGHGVLTFEGQNYPLSAGGVSVGFTIGASGENLAGIVENINNPLDIQGTYTQISASAAVGPGGTVIKMSNPNGVILSMQGFAAGLEASIDIGGLTLTLK